MNGRWGSKTSFTTNPRCPGSGGTPREGTLKPINRLGVCPECAAHVTVDRRGLMYAHATGGGAR